MGGVGGCMFIHLFILKQTKVWSVKGVNQRLDDVTRTKP